MSDRKLAILGIVAVLVVIWAVVQSRISSRPPAQLEKPGYLIMGLNPANIDSIMLGKGNNTVTLKRQGNRFVVVNKDNYPARVTEINNLLTRCQEIQWTEIVTDDPANHKDLGVMEEEARSIVKFMTPEPNSTLLAGVIIGKTKELGEGTYVRLLSGDQAASNKVYVAPSVPWINEQALNYIEQELISAERDDINSVTVSYPEGQYTLQRKSDSQDIILENMPEGKKLKTSEGQNVFTALADLRFDDVKRKTNDVTFDWQYICRLKDSTVYTVKIGQKDNKSYITPQGDFTDKTPVTIERKGESEEELKKKEAKLLARDKAEQFTSRHQGWVYEVADWKAKILTKKLSDLLEDEKKPQEPNEVKVGVSEATKIEDPNAIKVVEPNAIKVVEPNAVK